MDLERFIAALGVDEVAAAAPGGTEVTELAYDTRAVVPGDTSRSELVRRITASDPDERMPPPKSGKKLEPREIELLTRWVAEGAQYALHWSYSAPARPELPAVRGASWPRSARRMPPISTPIQTAQSEPGQTCRPVS